MDYALTALEAFSSPASAIVHRPIFKLRSGSSTPAGTPSAGRDPRMAPAMVTTADTITGRRIEGQRFETVGRAFDVAKEEYWRLSWRIGARDTR
jgi:hypothetical protein